MGGAAMRRLFFWAMTDSSPASSGPPTLGPREWSQLLLLGMVWGSSFFFFKILVAALPPFTVVFGRLLIAAAAMHVIARAARAWRGLSAREWAGFLFFGAIANALPFTLIAYGETRISSGMASILNATTPIFTVLVAHAFTHDDRLTWNRAVGVVACFVGVVVLVGPSSLTEAGRAALPGQFACLAASIAYGFAGVWARRYRGLAPLQVVTAQLTAACVVQAPLALIIDRPWTLASPAPAVWGSLFGLALLCTAFAYLLYFRVLKTAGATNVSLVTFLAPVSAILLGALLLHEPLEPRAMLGLAVIGLGLAAVDGRLLKRFAPTRA
jgi:drug/metabolite transporter (DMT)-like permease